MDGHRQQEVNQEWDVHPDALSLHQRLCRLETMCDKLRMQILKIEQEHARKKDDGK